MPRKTPVPESEKAIGARFREARESAGLRRSQLAKTIGVEAHRLRDYELGRSPVPYWLGAKLAEKMDACQRWLVTGRLPAAPYLDVDPVIHRIISGHPLFSEVYSGLLAQFADDMLGNVANVAKKGEADLEEHEFVNEVPLLAPPTALLLKSVRLHLDALYLAAMRMNPTQMRTFCARLDRLYHGLPHAGRAPTLTLGEVFEDEREIMKAYLGEDWERWLAARKTAGSKNGA